MVMVVVVVVVVAVVIINNDTDNSDEAYGSTSRTQGLARRFSRPHVAQKQMPLQVCHLRDAFARHSIALLFFDTGVSVKSLYTCYQHYGYY